MRINEYKKAPKHRNMAARRGTEDDARRDAVHRDRKHDYHRHDKYRKTAQDWMDELDDDQGF